MNATELQVKNYLLDYDDITNSDNYFSEVNKVVTDYYRNRTDKNKSNLYRVIGKIILSKTNWLKSMTPYTYSECLSLTVVGVERAIKTYNPNKCENNGFVYWMTMCIKSVHANNYTYLKAKKNAMVKFVPVEYLKTIPIDDNGLSEEAIDKIRQNLRKQIRGKIAEEINRLGKRNKKYSCYKGYENVFDSYYFENKQLTKIAKEIKENTHDISQRMMQLGRHLRKSKSFIKIAEELRMLRQQTR